MTSQLKIYSNDTISKLEINIGLSSILRTTERILKDANEINIVKFDFLPEQMYFGGWVAFQENNGDTFNRHLKFNFSDDFCQDEIKEIKEFLNKIAS